MDEKLSELAELSENEELPPILKEIPLANEDIFYKKEPQFVITTKGVMILTLIVACSVLIFLFFTYQYFILHTYKTEAYIKISMLYLLLIIFMSAHIYKRIKSPQVAEIYDSGIWLQDYKLYVPYERIYSTELIYPSHRKFIRSPFIYIFVSEFDRKKYLKSFSLKALNLTNREKNLLKLDLGTSEAFMKQDAQIMIDHLYHSAENHNGSLGIEPPYYLVEPKPGLLKRFLSLLPI